MEQSAKNHEHCCGGQHEELHDPVCGMAVTAESEHHAIRGGETYYFCSARCLEKLRASPDAYLAGEPGEHYAHEHGHARVTNAGGSSAGTYICPMHSEVQQVGPGSCPKCGSGDQLQLGIGGDQRAQAQWRQVVSLTRNMWR